MKHDYKTEDRIKAAAKKIFSERGLAGARMQDIADEAKINKAMLHYYFKNKQHLFDLIFDEKLDQLFSALGTILLNNLPLEEKIRQFIEEESTIIGEFPSLPIFIINEAWQNPDILGEKIRRKPLHLIRNQFKTAYEAHTSNANASELPFEQFMINMISLIIYPHIARPLFQHMLGLSNKDYKNVLKNRKDIVTKMVLQSFQI